MREIPVKLITNKVKEALIKTNKVLPDDIYLALKKSIEAESSLLAKDVLEKIVLNAEIAKEEFVPMCQDTGMVVCYVEIGYEVHLDGDIYDAINEGVRQAYIEGYLRKSVADPITRLNTTDNTPAIIHVKLVTGDKIEIKLAPKGAGSENMSIVKMLTPADGIEGIKKHVLDHIFHSGGKPCPPIIVGIGIGGNLEKSALIAKEALMRDLDDVNPDPFLDKLENELLSEINKLGVGPMGFGGKTTALGVKIAKYPTHIAALPLAINIQCHAARHIKIEIWGRDMKHISSPISTSELKDLRAGDIVYITGTIYTARDAAHKRLVADIKSGNKLNIDLKNATIYYVGPTPTMPGEIIGSSGPTTSYRMDPYAETLLLNGVKVMIGKGGRSDQFKELLVKYQAVYISAIGGTGALIKKTITNSEVVMYEDLDAEAIRKLEVVNFYGIVANDIYGNDIFEDGLKEFYKQERSEW